MNFKAGLMASALILGATFHASAADFVMKISTPTINDLQHEWMKRYEEELEKRTDGRIDVQLFPASQLGPIGTVLEGMQLGTIEASITPSEFYVGVDPRMQVPAVPALFDSMQDARTKLSNPDVREALLNVPVAKGIRGISVLVYGPQMIATREPVASLDDLKGQRVRVLASETETGTVNAIGAAGVPMPLNEVTTGLQQGTIDGVSTVIDVFVAFKWNEVAPHATDTGLWYLISVAAVSEAWLSSLPEDLQKAVLETAESLEQPMFERQLERDKENRASWVAAGGTVGQLPDADRQATLEAAAGVAESFLTKHQDMKPLYDQIKAAGSN